jgi:hypothetical protein
LPAYWRKLLETFNKRKSMSEYKVFVSHGSHDSWLAGQIAKELREVGAEPFLDETYIPKGTNFKKRVHEEIAISRELVALFTPWSANRAWVWVEIGAAWGREIPIVAVFYGMAVDDLEESGQGKAVLEDINVLALNDFDVYLKEVDSRIREADG